MPHPDGTLASPDGMICAKSLQFALDRLVPASARPAINVGRDLFKQRQVSRVIPLGPKVKADIERFMR